MEIKAKAKHIRMSPRKVRLVVDAVRGKEVGAALSQLQFINKLAVKPIIKLVNSAIASAEHNFEIEKNNLYIKAIRVDEGSTLHRWTPKAHGRATPIRKRASHVSLVLAEIKESGKKEAKKQKIEAPIKLDGQPKGEDSVKVKEAKKEKEISAPPAGGEKDKQIVDPRGEGRGGHTKIEGKSHKGFVGKMFRRKSG
ncbi:50S ribosomal protein L22 [Patescibacteria group bacterium]|nr:50S ribosomal protein L22 [Candidatus Falkowbacteria bacterium]MBU3905440.1 50S ribosomal protein L22 [Patescibacteria group bacterium]MBU4014800.1 50S ribosomal protein L22 [Patescibacteria group bacterium]MBU4027106.1 50S ribosomal protein L22 [Patescibacteria group bacterium]MBU4073332.1 50S ribosomal protein L22 [Patescibacteria group bacterium]